MKRISLILTLCAVLLATGCRPYNYEQDKEDAAQVVTEFYRYIDEEKFDSAMACTDLSEAEAQQMASLFGQLGMEIHEFVIDTVILSPRDTLAKVQLTLRVSNQFASDTARTNPVIPCVKGQDGWRVKFDF